MPAAPTPKIELHVHLEGAVRPAALIEIADRNGLTLPAHDVDELAELYRFRDFDHFIELWMMTTHVIRTEVDFRQVVVSYAQEAAGHGAVYIEGIFTPAERVVGGASWDEVFTGFCDGADEAKEVTGVEVRLTPDIPRGFPVEAAFETARYSLKYRERGIVGLGLGGRESGFPPEPFAPAFRIAKEGGLASVPHAGETEGVASIAARSMRSAPTASGTGSAPPTTLDCSKSSRRAPSSATCAPSRISARAPSIRSKLIRFR